MTRCIDSIEDLQDFVNNYKDIAFVPTMGNLHKGHLQLIKRYLIRLCFFINYQATDYQQMRLI